MREETLLTTDVRPHDAAARAGVSSSSLEKGETEIDLLEIGRVLLAHKFTILKSALIAASVVAVVVSLMKPTYTAKATFLPPNSMSSGSSALIGQLGALSGAGSALGGLKDPTQIYVGVLGSRTIADELIRKFDLANVYKTRKLSQTENALASHSEFISGKDTIISVNVKDHSPKLAADLANAYLAALHGQTDRIAFTEAGQKRLFFEGQLEQEKVALADAEVNLAQTQQKTGLIQPSGQARLQLETIAQTQADISSRETRLAAISQAATAENPDVIRMRSEIGALRGQLSRLENAGTKDGSGDVRIATSKVPELTLIYIRQEREVKYHEALYELLLRQYESAKLDESRSAPLMQVIDYAVVPDTKSGPRRTLLSAAAFFVGGLFGVGWTILKYVLNLLARDPNNLTRLQTHKEAATSRSS